jgi:hypothetical protein
MLILAIPALGMQLMVSCRHWIDCE